MDVRSYDPAIARWTSIDPLSHFDYSPYQAFDNNPVVFADPGGADSASSIMDAFSKSGSGKTTWYNDGNGGYTDDEPCPSCESEEDWQNYYSQARNTAEMLGEDFDYEGKRLTIRLREDGRRVFFLDGELMDLVRHKNRLNAFIHVFDVNLFLISALPNLFKIFGQGSKVIPKGFKNADEFIQAGDELIDALKTSKLAYNKIGVRGSSVTGVSSKGGGFRTGGTNPSDIDAFIEFSSDIGINASKNIPGFIHPNKLMKRFPALKAWAQKWSKILGREISPGGFKPGTMTDKSVIKF